VDSSIKYCLLRSSGSRHSFPSVFLREFLSVGYIVDTGQIKITESRRFVICWNLVPDFLSSTGYFQCREKFNLFFLGLNALVYIKQEWPHRLEDWSRVIGFAVCCELHMFDYFLLLNIHYFSTL